MNPFLEENLTKNKVETFNPSQDQTNGFVMSRMLINLVLKAYFPISKASPKSIQITYSYLKSISNKVKGHFL